MFNMSAINSMVTSFEEFIAILLRIYLLQNITTLTTAKKVLTYQTLLQCEDYTSIIDIIIEKEIEELLRDSHVWQIKYLDDNLKLGVEKEFSGWKNFIEILERRNIFVPTNGVVSKQYLSRCKSHKVDTGAVKIGDFLYPDYQYIRSAFLYFYEISVRIFQAFSRRLFPDELENADNEICDLIYNQLLNKKREVVEMCCEFVEKIPDGILHNPETKRTCHINRRVALKFSNKAHKRILHKIKWDQYKPVYGFAVAVLEDNFEKAEELIKNPIIYDQFSEELLKEIPLLEKFRETNCFKRAFAINILIVLTCEIVSLKHTVNANILINLN